MWYGELETGLNHLISSELKDWFGAPSTPPPDHCQNLILPKVMLAMIPENIKPLLENAKEVRDRLVQCFFESALSVLQFNLYRQQTPAFFYTEELQ
ncbi:hypothetical protein BYT27DRAFT_7203241 [Phlegmacium glaucopus]|nr:hypothetical protein BYT27DRAFT_7203241 [Phlegmacium glaucopus]